MSSKHPIDAAQPHRYVFSADDAGNVDAAMKYWYVPPPTMHAIHSPLYCVAPGA